MKKVLSIFAIATAVLSCSIEADHDFIEVCPETSQSTVFTSFHSTFGDCPETKTMIVDGKSVYWTPGDEILVFSGDNSAVFKSSNTEPAEGADFTGVLESTDSTVYALYPYQANASFSEGNILLTVPSVQYAEPGTFPKDAFVSLAKSHFGDLKFYHLCSLLKIRFAEDGIRELTFSAKGGEALAGKVSVKLDDKDIPSVAECVQTDSLITFKAPAGGFKKDVDYFMVLLPGTLESGFVVKAAKGTKTGTWEKDSATAFTRAVYSKATGIDQNMTFKEKADYSAPDGIITVEVAKKGGLEEALSGYSMDAIKAIKIKGVLDDVDFLQLSTYMTALEYLDIKEVAITALPQKALYNNSVIKTILLPETLTSIASTDLSGSAVQTLVFGSALETISSSAFSGCQSLENVIFPDDIALGAISSYVFQNCYQLKEISIPGSVTSIDAYAFSGCSLLEGVYFNSSCKVEAINGRAFNNCTSLKEISIPTSVKSIASYAFNGCSSLANIYFAHPSKLESLGVLSGLKALKYLEIPASVTSIASGAFNNCTSIESVQFENGTEIKEIGKWFSGCSSLKEFTIPASVETVVAEAFKDNSVITSIAFEEGSQIKEIGSSAFRNCSSLSGISIPEGVSVINTYLFDGCTGITSIVLPKTVTSVGNYAFNGCTNLAAITLSAPEALETIGNYAFYGSPITSFPFEGCSALSSIGSYAFQGTALAGEIKFAKALATIGDDAFYSVSGITKITIPDQSELTTIGAYAFYACTGLTKLTFNGVLVSTGLTIGNRAFYNCSALANVDAESCYNLTSIGAYAFGYCSSLRLFYNGTVKPATCQSTSFNSIASNAILKVRPESLSSYKSATGWSSFSSITALDGHVTGITLDCTEKRIVIGSELVLVATVSPDNADNKQVVWSSSDETVATVNQEGKVTAQNVGNAVIKAKAVDGGYSASCSITVYKPVESIVIPEQLVVYVGQEVPISATVLPEDATDKSLAWATSNQAASVSNDGIVTGTYRGSAIITVSAKDGSGITAQCNVTVKQYVNSIALNKTSLHLEVGENEVLSVESVLPDNADDKSYTWSSSKSSVATVDETGKVVAVSDGVAYIRATANDGSGVYAECGVSVGINLLSFSISYAPVSASYTSSTTIGGYSVGNQYRYNFLDVSECSAEEIALCDFSKARLIIPLGSGNKLASNGLNSISICDLLTGSQRTNIKSYFSSYFEYSSELDYLIWNYLKTNNIYYTYATDAFGQCVCLAYNTTSTSSTNGNKRVDLTFSINGSFANLSSLSSMTTNCGWLHLDKSYYYNGPYAYSTTTSGIRKVYLIDIATVSKIIWNCYLAK